MAAAILLIIPSIRQRCRGFITALRLADSGQEDDDVSDSVLSVIRRHCMESSRDARIAIRSGASV